MRANIANDCDFLHKSESRSANVIAACVAVLIVRYTDHIVKIAFLAAFIMLSSLTCPNKQGKKQAIPKSPMVLMRCIENLLTQL